MMLQRPMKFEFLSCCGSTLADDRLLQNVSLQTAVSAVRVSKQLLLTGRVCPVVLGCSFPSPYGFCPCSALVLNLY